MYFYGLVAKQSLNKTTLYNATTLFNGIAHEKVNYMVQSTSLDKYLIMFLKLILTYRF